MIGGECEVRGWLCCLLIGVLRGVGEWCLESMRRYVFFK